MTHVLTTVTSANMSSSLTSPHQPHLSPPSLLVMVTTKSELNVFIWERVVRKRSYDHPTLMGSGWSSLETILGETQCPHLGPKNYSETRARGNQDGHRFLRKMGPQNIRCEMLFNTSSFKIFFLFTNSPQVWVTGSGICRNVLLSHGCPHSGPAKDPSINESLEEACTEVSQSRKI